MARQNTILSNAQRRAAIINYYGSGGGGTPEELDTPSPIELEATREQTIGVQVIKVGQDANRFRIYSDSGLTTLVDEVEQAGNFYEFTGLTQSTQYWVTAEAKFGASYSDPIQANKFTLVNALFRYNFRGIPTDSENEFGASGEGAASNSEVTQIKSYAASANTLRPTTATESLIVNAITSSNNRNILGSVTTLNTLDQYTPDSTINFGSGDLTILFDTAKNNLLTTSRQIFSKNGDATIAVAINNGNLVVSFGLSSPAFYLAPWPSTLTAYTQQRLIIQLTGTSLRAGIMAADGTISWGSTTTISKSTFTPTFDRVFHSAVNIWYASAFFGFTSALSEDQIKREFRSVEKDDFSPVANDFSIAPKGITYSDLDADNYLIDANIGYASTSGSSWGGIYTHGDFTTYRGTYKDSLQQDFLRTFSHTTGKIGSAVDLGTPGSVVDAGGHNVGGLLAPFDNTFYHVEADIHYDKTLQTNLVFKRFGRNFNFSEYTQLRKGNGLIAHLGHFLQYEQGMRVGNYIILLCQEWSGAFAKWLTVLRFKDNCNFPEKIRIAQISATNWFYPTLLHREDGTIGIFLHYLLISATDRYENSFYIKTSSSAPFDSISNQQGTWTKNIVGGNEGATVTELNTNCIVGATGAGKANDCRVTAAYYDPTNDELYYTKLSGDATLLVGRSIANGAWSEATVDLNSRNIVCTYGEAGGIGHGSNIPTFVKTGANSYNGVVQEVISGAIWGVAEFQTSNFFSSTTYNGIVSPDNTTLHDRMMVTKNVHHTGGVDAYNEKRLLVCSREQTSPDLHADIWHYEL